MESSLDQFSVKENIRKWLVTSTVAKSKDKEREEFYDHENKRYEELLKIKDREKDAEFEQSRGFSDFKRSRRENRHNGAGTGHVETTSKNKYYDFE